MHKYARNPALAELLGMKAHLRPREKLYLVDGLIQKRARKVSENLRRQNDSSGERCDAST